jgi:hypothetical protein
MLAAAESDQQQLLTVNGKKKSKQLARLYRTRRKRFRHAVATFARQLVKDLYMKAKERCEVKLLSETKPEELTV